MVPSKTSVAVKWAVEQFDGADMHDTDCDVAQRLIAPRDGLYLVTAGIQWASRSDALGRTISIRVPGKSTPAAETRANLPDVSTNQGVTTLVRLVAGQSVEVWVVQWSGAGVPLDNTSVANASMHFVSDL